MLETPTERFKAQLRGELLRPGDKGYDTARKVWNGLIDKHPGLIVRCAGAGDVVHSVRFAREQDLQVAVRGGGHNIAGKSVCDGGLLIDLSPMKGMRVVPEQQTVRAQPGLRLSEFDRETQAFGLATTMGTASDTGIAGLTLGGGYGWLNGRWGLSCDNLLSVDLVTADGSLVTANAIENEDLYWGVRGAGANFGVVTSFKYQLHPVDSILGGMILHPIARGKEALQFFHQFSKTCPDELTTLAMLMTTPDGLPAVGIAACYCGSIARGEEILKPLRMFGEPIPQGSASRCSDSIAPRTYVEMQSLFDENARPGQLNYWKTSLIDELSEAAIETLLEQFLKRPTPTSLIYFQQMHGAATRPRPTDTAYPHRFYHYDFGIWAIWQNSADTEKCISWVQDSWKAMRPFSKPFVYVNVLGDDVEERVHEAYGPNYERLVALKNKYDPTNFFFMNGNIKPELVETKIRTRSS